MFPLVVVFVHEISTTNKPDLLHCIAGNAWKFQFFLYFKQSSLQKIQRQKLNLLALLELSDEFFF